MAIDTNAPLLIPAGVNGNVYGLTNGINVLNSTNSGLSINYSGGSVGGTLTFNTFGNLNSLATYNEIGLVYYVGGNQFENAALTGSTGILLTNVGASYTFSVISNSTTQNFLTQHNSGSENLTAGNLNLIAGEGISIAYSVASNIANYTISSAQTGAISDATYVTLTNELASLPNSFDLGSLTTGLLKNTVTDGVSVLSMAIVNTDYQAANATLTELSALELTNGSILFYNGVELTNLVPGTVGQYIAVDESGVPAYTTPATASDATFVLLQADAALPNSFGLGTLTSGLLKQTVTAGLATIEIAVSGVDYQKASDYLSQIGAITPSAGSLITYNESLASYEALTIGLPGAVLAVDSGGTALGFIPQANIFDGLLAATNTWTGVNTFTAELNANDGFITNYLTTTVGATLAGTTQSTTIVNSGAITTNSLSVTSTTICAGGILVGSPTAPLFITQTNFSSTQSADFALFQSIAGATVLNTVAGEPLGFSQGGNQVGQVNAAGVWILPTVEITSSITAPTQATGTSNTTLATTQFVQEAIDATGGGGSVSTTTGWNFLPSTQGYVAPPKSIATTFQIIGNYVFVTLDGTVPIEQQAYNIPAPNTVGAAYLSAPIPSQFQPISMANPFKLVGIGNMYAFNNPITQFQYNLLVNIAINYTGGVYYLYITPQPITTYTSTTYPYNWSTFYPYFGSSNQYYFGTYNENPLYTTPIAQPNLTFSYPLVDI